jgi:ABC-2 type transport system permease protein
VRFLLRIQFLKIKNWVTRSSAAERIKAASFACLGLLFFGGLHWGFFRFLTVIRNVELIGDLLLLKILAMAFMTSFLMIIFSSTLASFSTLFFARDLSMLVHTPLPYRTLFAFKSLETTVFSSWMMAMALLPFLAAYGQVTGQGPAFYLLLTALGVPFVWIASALGIALSLALMCLFPARRVRDVMLVLAVLICTGLFLWVRWLAPAKFLRADTMEFLIQYISLLETPTAPFLPSYWLAQALGGFAAGRVLEALQFGGILVGTALAVTGGLLYFGEKAYYGGWTSAQESPRRNRPAPLGREWRWVPPIFGVRFRAILGKDLAVFRRDSNQWSQLLMLLSIVAIYLISIRKLPLDTRFLRGLISFLNIGMVGFVLASVGLRFVFPAVSLEGRSWWALRSAPMGLWEILWGKFLGGVVPIAVMGVALVWVSNAFLGVDRFVVWLSNGTVFVLSITLAGMGVGFGALFPRFGMENVAQIQTSAGGLVYMGTALFYVGVTLALEAVVVRAHYFSGRSFGNTTETLFTLAALALLNVVAFTAPLLLGKRKLERADL